MFNMLAQSDLFIFYDDAQFTRQSWQTRNRIKTKNGVKWISIGIDRRYKLGMPIRQVSVNHRENWVDHNLNQIRDAYRQARYFEQYFPILEDFLRTKSDLLVDYTAGSVRLLADLLAINAHFAFSSSFNITESRGAQKVLDICLAAGADEYFDGASGRELYEVDFFARHGVKIHFHEYEHPVYTQLHGEFISHLSAIDLLFNEGPNALTILRGGGRNKF